MKQQNKTTGYALLIGIISVIMYLLPLLINQQDSCVLIHDNLDCHPMQFANIYRGVSPIIHDSQFPQILNGCLRPSSGINLNFAIIPFHFLSPYSAYLFIQITSRLVAYFGMFLLLSCLFKKTQPGQLVINCGVSALFAMLPHYPPLAYTIPTLPWLCWSFLSIRNRQARWYHWAVLTTVPFFSNFFVAPIFLMMLVGASWFIEGLRSKQWHSSLFWALVICGAVYIVSEHRLLLSLFNDTGYESVRTMRTMDAGWTNMIGALRKAAANFILGQYHVFSLHEYILLITGIAIFLHVRARNGITREFKSLLSLLVLCGIISLWLGIYYWRPLAQWRTTSWGFFSMIGWDRFHWLHPLLWYVILAYALVLIFNHSQRGKYLAVSFMLLQGVYAFSCSDYLNEKRTNGITFKQFYAEQQFQEIKEFIGKDPATYRVASLGIHPSISIFNGFYALDGYATDYDIAYKKEFRTIIEPELKQNPALNRYFETYGLRCYLFSSELGKYPLYTKWKNRSIERLDINIKAFSSLNGQYILSAVEIKQAEDCGLRLLQVFNSPNSAWRIYLYQPVIAPNKPEHKKSSACNQAHKETGIHQGVTTC